MITTNRGQDQAHVRVQNEVVDVCRPVLSSVRDSAGRAQRVRAELGLESKRAELLNSAFDAVGELRRSAP